MNQKKWEYSLDGTWQLTGTPEPGAFSTEIFHLTATVPGNIELDLQNAGIIGDPLIRMNAKAVRNFEYHHWRYQRDFVCNDAPSNVELVLEGVDCLAEYFINGVSIGKTENALIQHRLPINGLLKNGNNTITVDLTSPSWKLHDMPLECGMLGGSSYNYAAHHFRKPPHSWGWDICPRLPLGGIFRSLRLEAHPPCRIAEDRMQLLRILADGKCEIIYQFRIENSHRECRDMKLVLDGVCTDSHWHYEEAVWAPQGHLFMVLDGIHLWYPQGYGTPDLYDVCVRLVQSNEVIAEHVFTTGFRLVELQRNEIVTPDDKPDFQFLINSKPIRVHGVNHVPADVLHSRDRQRLPKILELLRTSGANMVRMWGGNLYEDDIFYNFCDRNGILIWQDFMMACGTWPRDEEFQKKMTEEAVAVIRRLRHHPALVLWSGDNECDASYSSMLLENPAHNILTRRMLPELCSRHDPGRPYLPSSPLITPESLKIDPENPYALCPEQHPWGAREYYKNAFYSRNQASFASEIGMPGCPDIASLKEFLSPEYLWPETDNPEWIHHASCPFYPDSSLYLFRIPLLRRHIKLFFGFSPENLEDFALASQCYQAEALKYLVERQRTTPKYSGILLWNLIDAWPVFSESLVDYYFRKKLSFNYVRRAYQNLFFTISESANWNREIIMVNDGESKTGELVITRFDEGHPLKAINFTAQAHSISRLPGFADEAERRELLMLKWKTTDGITGCNHFLIGEPHFDFAEYTEKWLPAIAALDGTFDAALIAR